MSGEGMDIDSHHAILRHHIGSCYVFSSLANGHRATPYARSGEYP